jgi:hypothetical protein
VYVSVFEILQTSNKGGQGQVEVTARIRAFGAIQRTNIVMMIIYFIAQGDLVSMRAYQQTLLFSAFSMVSARVLHHTRLCSSQALCSRLRSRFGSTGPSP